MLQLLADRAQPPDEALPETGVGIEWERRLGPVFISGAAYGTRASTLVRFTDAGVEVVEESFAPEGRSTGAERAFLSSP